MSLNPTKYSVFFLSLLLLIVAASAFSRKSRKSSNDPKCVSGDNISGVCCPKICSRCKPSSCNYLSIKLHTQCCVRNIKNSRKSCNWNHAPCLISKNPNNIILSFVPRRRTNDPKCKKGRKNGKACCPKKCGRCVHRLCKKQTAFLHIDCCPSSILRSGRSCAKSLAPCVVP